MKVVKTIAISSILFFSTTLLADKYNNYEDKYKHDKKEKYEKKYEEKKHTKYKQLPPGLEKKVHKDGKLPPGWEKKYQRGEVLDKEDLRKAREIRDYKKYPEIKGTKVYEIQDKIFRVTNATREILEVFK
ncbi:hypothetical protein [Halarcobacter bivalviorum]|uniref:RcnB family protein n=1 Tax=Halarcobacter bivalviorum TaxID=663364 RepID=A0AAX2A5H1_9BACT|nr:hypothetical protein [Halarcobacter bivalviorum]AXH11190.1 hypothetical protein ABIV_0151 [Halarcobacter bivalviorum]RXK05789.1 hypothetical protein CRU97_07730 [Halarcobacter bivalviorum]RXK09462.1 hypothetical protein CRV05_09125 [Halarcobacter bivalviorum]